MRQLRFLVLVSALGAALTLAGSAGASSGTTKRARTLAGHASSSATPGSVTASSAPAFSMRNRARSAGRSASTGT